MVKDDALGEASTCKTLFFGPISDLSGYLRPFTSGKRYQLARQRHRLFSQHDEIDHDHPRPRKIEDSPPSGWSFRPARGQQVRSSSRLAPAPDAANKTSPP